MSRQGGDRTRAEGARDGGANDAAVGTPGRRTLVEGAYRGTGRAPLLSDRDPVPPGGMSKAAFLAQLRPAVKAAAEQAMAATGATDRCPYIEAYFAKYSGQPASALEALIGKWVPAAHQVTSASDLIPLVVERVGEGVRSWQATGALPSDLAAADPGLAAEAAAAAAAGATGGPAAGVQAMSLASMERELGPGQPLDGATASRMSGAIGADVSGARIHSGPTARALAAQVDAAAFAVGQNVVLGGGLPADGSIEMDALLAHELTHTAQQRDASMDPAARKRPIGAEDDAAERDAGVARLGSFAGQVGDVMRTGLQLQRCENKKLAGPPMAGKQADEALESLDMVKSRIGDNLKNGINAASTTTFHDSKESFAKAWFEKSLLVPSMWKPDLTPEQLDAMRWQRARELADKGGGFTNYQTHEIHIYTPGTPAFVTIHELVHLHTATSVYSSMGDEFVEGAADYYTSIACKKNNIPFESTYSDQMIAIQRLVAAAGEDAVASLVFNGNEKYVQDIVDSRGAGTWKKYKKLLSEPDYAGAAKALEGVKDANAAREASEQAELDRKQKDADKERDAAKKKEQEGWPPEGKSAVSARVIATSVVGGKGRATIARGGKDGVREGWLARATLKDGTKLEATVIDVSTRSSQIEIPDLETAKAIEGQVELRPPAR